MASAPLVLEKIAGGASPRKFYRVKQASGASAILMIVPDNTPDVAKARELGRGWPFLELRELLEQTGVRVPRLLFADTSAGFLMVEDLGQTLAEYLEAEPERRDALYLQAVRDLARAQTALDPLPEQSIVRLRAFDFELLHWEIQHFREFGLEARGVTLSEADAKTFDRAAAHLARTIDALKKGFTHRDYQSRNLMVCPSEQGLTLGWIDFQDALLGPRAYDLVALLCDSYQPFRRDFVERCLDEYAAKRQLSDTERKDLGREFDLISVQRKLKDAGRFVFIEKKKGDPSFLRYFEPTLAIVRQALARLADDPILAELDRFVRGLG